MWTRGEVTHFGVGKRKRCRIPWLAKGYGVAFRCEPEGEVAHSSVARGGGGAFPCGKEGEVSHSGVNKRRQWHIQLWQEVGSSAFRSGQHQELSQCEQTLEEPSSFWMGKP